MSASKIVYKYNLPFTGDTKLISVHLPSGAEILSVDVQPDAGDGYYRPKLWALVQPDAALTVRRFGVVPTSMPIPYQKYEYIGSFGDMGNTFIFHCFEVLEDGK